MGRRRESRRKLGRTNVQIKVMSALAFSWISTQTSGLHSKHLLTIPVPVFMVAMMTQNREACHHNLWRPTSETCGFFTTVHILSWFLIIVCEPN